MKVCLIEAVDKKEDSGSIGAYFIEQAVKRAGHSIERIPWNSNRFCYDVELISVHHPSNFSILKKTQRHARIRIIGGHITYASPRPVIPLCDAVCLGDGEEWIVKVLSEIEKDREYFEKTEEIPGGIITRVWYPGKMLPPPNFIKPLPLNNPPYLNNEGELNATWYIEIARGCPFKCWYCEVGASMPYRIVPYERIEQQLYEIDRFKSDRVAFFASDEASHPRYKEMVKLAGELGFRQTVGLYRLDQIMKHDLKFRKNQLVKVGVDGLTEATRMKVGKNVSDQSLYIYFKTMTERGHKFFKIYQIFGYPWEKYHDFDQFEALMERIFSLPVKETCKILIKWAPLIPRPLTKLSDAKPKYSEKMVRRIKAWHNKHKDPANHPGWIVELDQGIQTRKTHKRHCSYYKGDETELINDAIWVHSEWRKYRE